MAATATSIRTSAPQNDLSALKQENIELKTRLARLERLTLLDTLTPLYNRRHFMDVLDRWIWRAHRHGMDCGLLFIDVDQLKAVNDTLGHSAGDCLLMAVAETLRMNVRRSDVVARIGGDEFGILLEKVDSAALPGKANKIANAVAAQTINYAETTIVPGVSVGYAMIEANVQADEILIRADKSMYADKAERRLGSGPLATG